MRRDCPHCFARVLPSTEGRCPHCQGDMSVAKTLPLSTVRVSADAELPALCVACGQATSNTILLAKSKSEGGQSWPVKVLAFLASPLLFAAMHREFQAKKQDVRIALPFCTSCGAGGGEPRLTFVNFERQEVTLIVHDNFANAFRGA